MSATKAVLAYLESHPKAATGDIVTHLSDWEPRTVENALYQLRKQGRVETEPQYRTPNLWSLTENA